MPRPAGLKGLLVGMVLLAAPVSAFADVPPFGPVGNTRCADDAGVCGLCDTPGDTCYNGGPHENERGSCEAVDCKYPLDDQHPNGQGPCNKCISQGGCSAGSADASSLIAVGLALLLRARRRLHLKKS